MTENIKPYFITALVITDNKDHWAYGHTRCFGFFFKKETAIRAIKENWGDMHERLYNYIVIETIGEGICPIVEPVQENYIWFKWEGDSDNGKWVETTCPKGYNNICNFALG